jgi:hypothetical protein
MMLLALDEWAELDAIEHAPPLGSRADVLQRMGGAFPAATFDDGGRAIVEGPDSSLTIDLGTQDPVWTATVEPRGRAGLEAARALATVTGWRLFVPKHGTFADAAEKAAEKEEVRS